MTASPRPTDEELREWLENGTKGDWQWRQGLTSPSHQWTLSPGILIADTTNGTPDGDSIDQANAALIENARRIAREVLELRAAKWDVKHVDTMNDMAALAMARDDAERERDAARKREAALRAELARLREGVTTLAGRLEARSADKWETKDRFDQGGKAAEAEVASALRALHEKLAQSHPSLERGRVWCRHCRRTQRVDSAERLRTGWPKCCGYTMTIDHPDTWEDTPNDR